MVKYIILCKQPSKPKITISNHLIDSDQINCYSLTDLQDLSLLKKNLTDFHSELFEHITKNCEVIGVSQFIHTQLMFRILNLIRNLTNWYFLIFRHVKAMASTVNYVQTKVAFYFRSHQTYHSALFVTLFFISMFNCYEFLNQRTC